jgi:hypothetical protein
MEAAFCLLAAASLLRCSSCLREGCAPRVGWIQPAAHIPAPTRTGPLATATRRPDVRAGRLLLPHPLRLECYRLGARGTGRRLCDCTCEGKAFDEATFGRGGMITRELLAIRPLVLIDNARNKTRHAFSLLLTPRAGGACGRALFAHFWALLQVIGIGRSSRCSFYTNAFLFYIFVPTSTSPCSEVYTTCVVYKPAATR